MATHFHQLKIKDIRRETAACISVAFEIPPHLENEFAFIQGQNITLKAIVGGEEIRRSYSLCSSPLENELRIAVKKVPDGRFSAWVGKYLKIGALLDVLPPSGKFYTVLDAANKKNYMAFAAGSGITPLFSIIKTTLLTEPGSSFTLFYGNRNRASVIFKEELEALKNKYMSRFSIHHIFSREKAETQLNSGRIDTEKCENIFTRLVNIKSCDEFFLCGPAEMIFSVSNYLEKKSVEKKKIHYELFTVPGSKIFAGGDSDTATAFGKEEKMSSVTIISNGFSFDFDLPYDGESILNAAMRLGADLPFACKGGVCATCRAKLTQGKVFMDNNYALEAGELEKDYILTCQSHPRSDKIVVDFDHI